MLTLITGSDGFIGNHLIEEIEKQQLENRIIKFKGDLLDKSQIEKTLQDNPDITQIIHLAGIFGNEFQTLLINNVLAFQNLLDSIKPYKITNIVYTSTGGIYGDAKESVSESQEIKPNTLYALTKYMGEQLLQYHASINSYSYTILRLTNVYGKNGRGVINKFIDSIKATKQINIHGDGTQCRDFVNVSDVAKIICNFIKNPINENKIYNVSSEQPYTLNQLIEKFAKVVKFETVYSPSDNNLSRMTLSSKKIQSDIDFKFDTNIDEYIYNELS